MFVTFSPAMSDKAAHAIRAEIRSWHIGKRGDKTLNDLENVFNAKSARVDKLLWRVRPLEVVPKFAPARTRLSALGETEI